MAEVVRRVLAPGIEMYLGDCREIMETWVSGLTEESPEADLILTDPPYGIDYVNEAGKRLANDKEPPLWCVPLMEALLKPESTMYVFTRWDVFPEWQGAMSDCGLRNKAPIIWVKGSGGQGDCLSGKALNYEMLIESHKGRPINAHWTDEQGWKGNMGFPKGGTQGKLIKRDDSVWYHPRPRSTNDLIHPTTKPDDLMARAILNSSHPGDLVLDPFAGSGPVGVAAVKTGRRYIGMEIDPEYFELACANILRAIEENDDDV